jgi:excisionase family DNA binding protein
LRALKQQAKNHAAVLTKDILKEQELVQSGISRAALLSIAEAAGYLNISRSSLLRLTYGGQIPSVTLLLRRLYSPGELDQWIKSHHGYMGA